MEAFLSSGVASSQEKESKIEDLERLVEDYKKQVDIQQVHSGLNVMFQKIFIPLPFEPHLP